MQKPPEAPATEHLPLAACWHRLRTYYRIANLATHHVLGFTVKLALVIYFAFTVLFLVLRYAILPNIDYYKGDLERVASKAVGNPVQIARVYASWRGLRPNLFLGDVSLRDQGGHELLKLPSVSATVSWWSLLAADVRFHSLEIIRPDLEVHRAANGKMYVAGVWLNPDKPGDGRGADWLLQQREIVIRDGRLRWVDGQRGNALALEQLNFIMRNRWRHHMAALHVTPPAGLAAPIDLRARFSRPAFGDNNNFKRWKGELYADLKQVDLAAWKNYFDYPMAVAGGHGALRAWIDVDHAKLSAVTADLDLSKLDVTLDGAAAPLALQHVHGRIAAGQQYAASLGKRSGAPLERWLAINDFTLETADGLRLDVAALSAQHLAAHDKVAERTELKASTLDLGTVAALAQRLPLAAPQRQLIEQAAPRGRLEEIALVWQGPMAAPLAYRIKGRAEGLGFNPLPAQAAEVALPGQAAVPARGAMPGVAQFSGSIDASERGGSVAVRSRDMVLQMPAWFFDPVMPFEQFNLNAQWTLQGEDGKQLRVQVDGMDFIQQGLSGTLQGSFLQPPKGAPASHLGLADLSGTLKHFDLKTIGRYLPIATPQHLRQWLTGALEEGMAEDVNVRVRGELSQFPFKGESAAERARGEFRVAGRLDNARLNYSPGSFAKDGKSPQWPQAEHIKGSFLFERTRMEIRGDTAITAGVALSEVKAVIPDLSMHNKMLEIDGNGYGPMQQFLHYLTVSPVLEWIGHFTDQSSATGNARLALKLRLPLEQMHDAAVQGSVQLLGNDVQLFHDLPVISGATGKIEFNERGVNLNALAGTFLGGPTAISGGTQKDNAIQVKIGGAITGDGLRRQFNSPTLQRLLGRISGTARYNGLITARDHQVKVEVDSPLAGMDLDFPAPARKGAADAMPLRFVMTAGAPNDAGVTQDEIRIGLGNIAAARYQRQRHADGPWHVLRGGIGVNVPAPEPDSGLMLNVNLKSLDVDAWTSLGGPAAAPNPAGAAGAVPASADDSAALSQYVIPDVMAARAGELLLGGRKLENVVVGATHDKGVWQANIDSTQASGYVTWNDTPSGLGKMTARLSSLIIPESAAADVKDMLEGKNTAAQSIPSLDIVVERFELFNRKLGRLELQAYNAVRSQAPGTREWRVSNLTLANPDGTLKGTGKWLLKDGQSNTSLNFGLDIVDAGKLLDRFGFVDTVRNGKGRLSGDIHWKGLPYSLDIPSMGGQLDMNIEKGQFLKQDPGAAKLLGVLSLQALPRLLKLDFHDVFSEGLAFDGITAYAVIDGGVVRTENLKMHGVAATVLMHGSADIANESTDLHVVVIPEFNLGTGPLVYALAVNPVIGLGSFLAQLFLRAPVMKALTYQMRVAGPWKAPVITKLEGDKVPVSAAPAVAN